MPPGGKHLVFGMSKWGGVVEVGKQNPGTSLLKKGDILPQLHVGERKGKLYIYIYICIYILSRYAGLYSGKKHSWSLQVIFVSHSHIQTHRNQHALIPEEKFRPAKTSSGRQFIPLFPWFLHILGGQLDFWTINTTKATFHTSLTTKRSKNLWQIQDVSSTISQWLGGSSLSGHITWRIIPFSKYLATMFSKSPIPGVVGPLPKGRFMAPVDAPRESTVTSTTTST